MKRAKMWKRLTAAALVLSFFSFSMGGCFGKFALTRKVYKFNQEIHQNRFVQTLMMWVMLIIPVYAVVTLVDFLIFNLIELFTGNNPIAYVNDGKVVVERDGQKAVISRSEDKVLIDFYEGGVYQGLSEISVDDQGVVSGRTDLGEQGAFAASYQNGIMTIADLSGGGVQILDRKEIETELNKAGLPVNF